MVLYYIKIVLNAKENPLGGPQGEGGLL